MTAGDRGDATGLNVITHIGLDDADGALDFGDTPPSFIMLQSAIGMAIG